MKYLSFIKFFTINYDPPFFLITLVSQKEEPCGPGLIIGASRACVAHTEFKDPEATGECEQPG